MAFQSRKGSGNTWNPKDETLNHEKKLIGHITNIKTGVGEHGQTVYEIEDEKNIKYDVWGDSVLNSESGLGGLPIGTYVSIEYLGRKAKKGKEGSSKSTDYFNNWDVQDDPEMARKPGFAGNTTGTVAAGHPANPLTATEPAVKPLEVPSNVNPTDSLPF